jgi:hypothetical protein
MPMPSSSRVEGSGTDAAAGVSTKVSNNPEYGLAMTTTWPASLMAVASIKV